MISLWLQELTAQVNSIVCYIQDIIIYNFMDISHGGYLNVNHLATERYFSSF